MKSTTFAALFALLSSGAQAVHHGHGHAGRHADLHLEKRDVVWVTEYEVETVTVLETVYDYGSFVSTAVETTAPSPTSSDEPAPTTSNSAPATTLQTSSSPPAAPSSSSTTSSTTTTTSPAPVLTTSSPAYQPPAQSFTSSYQPPVQSTTSAYQAPAPSTTSAAPAAASSAAPAGISGNYQSGEVTFYDFTAGALGACGVALDPTANTVAISEELYGTYGNPNDSPMCGKKLTIIGTDGTSYSATVADRCVACDNTHLDLTHGLFGTVTGSNYNTGVVPIKWAWD